MLMGLVTKNAILLVDFAIRAREGTADHPAMGRTDALLMAARVRLRPILMTTLAMVFGMVPLAFALSEGSEQRAPMGQAVIGGVITSSILTPSRKRRTGVTTEDTTAQVREIQYILYMSRLQIL
jgi:HAE1 family hydrophobic/amphiphilic exporter-1